MRIVAIACVVGVGFAALAGAQPAPAGHVRMSSSRSDIDDTSGAAVRLPYEIDPGWRMTEVSVIDVALGGRRDRELSDAFTRATVIDDASIELAIQRAALKWSGDYQVLVRFTLAPIAAPAAKPAAPGGAGASAVSAGSGSAGSPAPVDDRVYERTTLTITRTPPKLKDPHEVSIKLTRWLVDDSQTVSPLLLVEEYRRSRLTGIHVQHNTITLHDGAPTSVRLEVGVGSGELPPGGQLELPIVVKGDVPWGTSSGSLQISTDQLAPTTVNFAIEHRRWTGYIPILFALGGLLGFAIRTWAKGITDRVKLQSDGAAVLALVKRLTERALPAERVQLADARARILDAAKAQDDAALKTAIDAAVALATEVSATQTKQLEDRRARLARYAQMPGLLLGPQIGVELAGYGEAIASIEDALLDHDVARAERGLAALAAGLEARRDALLGWVDRLATAIVHVASAAGRGPVALRARWVAVTGDPIRIALHTKPDLLDVFEITNPELVALEEHVFQSRLELTRLASEAKARLGNAPRVALALGEALGDAHGDLPARLAQLAASIEAWFDVLGQVIEPMMSSGSPQIAAGAAAAMAARNAGDYDATFRMLNDLLERPLGGTEPEVPTLLAPMAPRRLRAPAPVVSEVGGPDDAELVSLGLRRKAAWVRALQVATAYAVLPFGAWVAYHETFVGLLPELIAIAATGFITDFTADAAAAKLQALKK